MTELISFWLFLSVVAVYFYLPGALANVGAVVSRFIPGFRNLTTPIDFGITFRGQRLVGEHKTLGGLFFGVLFGVVAGTVKFLFLDPLFPTGVFLELNFWTNLWLCFLLSFGAVGGDLLKSFFKRQVGVDPHKPFVPFDEIDHSLTALLLAKIFFPIPWIIIALTIFLYFFIHAGSNVIGYWLKIKKVPY